MSVEGLAIVVMILFMMVALALVYVLGAIHSIVKRIEALEKTR